MTNYFEMKIPKDLVLNSYTIKFTAVLKDNGDKTLEPKGKKLKQIIRIMLSSRDFVNWKNIIATDFQENLISLGTLPESIRNQKVEYFHEVDGVARSNAQTYHLHIVPAVRFPSLSISELVQFLASTAADAQYPAKSSMVDALNTLIGHYTNSTSTTSVIGGKRAFPQNLDTRPLGAGLNALRGFFASVRLASYRTLINVNVSHGAFYNPVPLCDLMESYGVTPYDELETFVKGLKVRTNYLKDKEGEYITMVKTISGFAHETDGSGQNLPPKVDEYAGSPSQVWFYLKDSAEFARLTAGKSGKINAKSVEGSHRKKLKADPGRGPNYISICEFFGESMIRPIS